MAAGIDAPYNPFWALLDPGYGVGLAGHSYGAAGVSYVGQWDPRVKTIVAWDDLGGPGPHDAPVPGAAPGAPSQTIGEAGCPSTPADRTVVPLTKPALGMSADYGLPPAPNTQLPDPNAKSTWSLSHSKAGVDTGEIIIRGGSHLDFSFIPNQAFGASLRGADEIAWYTTAWFDKYLKPDPSADARLDIHLASGSVWDCEGLRDGCPGMVTADGYPGVYSYLAVDTSPHAVTGPGASLRATSSLAPCPARSGAITFRLRRFRGRPITQVRVYVGRRRVTRTVRGCG